MTHTLRALYASAFLAIALAAGDAGAQAASEAAGPSLDAATTAVRAPVAATEDGPTAAALQQGGFGRAEALMLVGGAALVAGLVIGDDAGTILALGGAIVGLYGFYLWLQPQGAILGTRMDIGG